MSVDTWGIAEQIILARDLMSGFGSRVTNICVAGGAIRDWKMGTPAQDIDIYLSGGSRGIDRDFICNLLGLPPKDIQIGRDFGECKHTKKYEGCEDYDITCIKEFTIRGQTIQLIFAEIKSTGVSSLSSEALPVGKFGDIITSGFCVNLSKGFMGPACDMVESREMAADRLNNTLTISPKGLNLFQSYRLVTHYLPKMQLRFPDRRIVMEEPDSEDLLV